MASNARRLAVAAAMAAALAGCGKSSTTTEMFSGSVGPQSSDSHAITTVASGEITATLTSVTPPITLGLAIGSESTGACTRTAANDIAVAGTALSQDTTDAGPYCITVFDVGNATGPVSYTLLVTHP